MARPSFFRAWDDAPAFLLSCPGPLRHHHAAVQPIAQLSLPQCLLGSEAQLLAFAAAQPDLAPRLFFVPLPEMFASPASLDALGRLLRHRRQRHRAAPGASALRRHTLGPRAEGCAQRPGAGGKP